MSKTRLPDDEHGIGQAARTKKQVQNAAKGSPTEWSIIGKRTDLTDGFGPRLRIGFDTGTPPAIIIERWSETGAHTVATFA